MILIKLSMENFRQYYGEAEIDFSVPDDIKPHHNITLIHGENGVGKTTLMNAITWCLYERLAEDFEGQEKLVNEVAFSEGTRTCNVEVIFKLSKSGPESEKSYRSIRIYDQSTGTQKHKVFEIDAFGNNKEHLSPKSFINNIVPQEMCRYFFFHGEGLTNIQSSDGGSYAFRKAVRAILGCTFVEQAISDLSQISKKLTSEISSMTKKNKDHDRLTLELDSAQREKTEQLNRREVLRSRIVELESEIESVDEKIRNSNIDLARQYQRHLDKSRTELRRLQDQIVSSNEKQVSLIQSYGWKVFGAQLSQQAKAFIEDASHKGRIPAPFDRPFVETILTNKSCICGRPVIPGTKEEEEIRGLIETANDELVGQKKIRAGSVADRMTLDTVDFPQLVLDCEEQISDLELQIKGEQESIDEYARKLKQLGDSNVDRLDEQRTRAKNLHREAVSSEGACSERIRRLDIQISDTAKRLREALPPGSQSDNLRAMSEFVEKLEARCHSLLIDMEDRSKSVIANEVNELLKKYSTQDYRIKIDHNYGFHLVRADGSVVSKSKGENLLLNLAFVSALIKHARLRSKASGQIFIPGAVAPFVIDAPFGELDKAYRSATAKFLPESSEQLILLLSSSHWTEDIDQEIRNRIGKEYILFSHKDVAQEEKPSTPLAIQGKIYQQAAYGTSRRMTTIEEIQ